MDSDFYPTPIVYSPPNPGAPLPGLRASPLQKRFLALLSGSECWGRAPSCPAPSVSLLLLPRAVPTQNWQPGP